MGTSLEYFFPAFLVVGATIFLAAVGAASYYYLQTASGADFLAATMAPTPAPTA